MQLTRHGSFSRSGGPINEDVAFSSPGAVIVLDGASGLSATHVTPGATDAEWFARSVGKALHDRVLDDRSLPELIDEVVREVANDYSSFPGAEDSDLVDRPTACLTVVRERADCVELWSLGDCTAVVVTDEGTEVIHDDSVSDLDALVLKSMRELARQCGVPLRLTRPLVSDLVREHRGRQNTTPGGYGVIDTLGRWSGRGLHRMWPLASVVQIAVMTDGFVASIPLVESSVVALATAVFDGRAREVVDATFDRLDSDPDWEAHPRLKHKDDATVAWMSRGPAPTPR